MPKLEYRKSDEPILVSEVVKRINEATNRGTPQLTVPAVFNWLVSAGLLEKRSIDGGKEQSIPTPRGETLGIVLENRVSARGPYTAVLYTAPAQQFIADHLDEIIRSQGQERKQPFAPSQVKRSDIKFFYYPITISFLVRQINRTINRETMCGIEPYPIIKWLCSVGLLKWVDTDERARRAVPTTEGEALGITWKEGAYLNGSTYTGVLYSKAAQQYIVDHLDDIVAFDRASSEKPASEGPEQRSDKDDEAPAAPLQEGKAERTFSALPIETRTAIETSNVPVTISEITDRINKAMDRETMPELSHYIISNWLLSLGLLENVSLGDGEIRRRPTTSGEELGIFFKTGTGKKGPYTVTLYTEAAQKFIIDNLEAIVEFNRSGTEKRILEISKQDIKRVEDASPKSHTEAKRHFALTMDARSSIELSDEPISIIQLLDIINDLIDEKAMEPLHFSSVSGWLLFQGFLKKAVTDTGEQRVIPTHLGEELGIIWKTGTSMKKGKYAVALYNRNAQQFVVDHLDDIIEFRYTYVDSEKPGDNPGVDGQGNKPRDADLRRSFYLPPEVRADIELADIPIGIMDLVGRINRLVDQETMHILHYRYITDWLRFIGLLDEDWIGMSSSPSPQGKELGIFLDWNKTSGPYRKLITQYSPQAQRFIVDHLDDITEFNRYRSERNKRDLSEG